jgi:hypothetical protein
MPTVDLLGDEAAQDAADEDISGKVLLSADAGVADHRSQSVSQQLWQRSRIFMSDHTCHCPCRSRVLGRERRASLKEVSRAVSLQRSLPAQRVFQRFNGNQAVEGGLTSEQASFTPMVIVGGIAQQPQACRTSDQRTNPGTGNRVVVTDRLRIVR